jgi:mono/diheme cytochrome c family protein
MRFLRDALITVLLLGTVAAVAVFAAIRNGGLSANEGPNRLESAVAKRLVRISIPADADRQRNPFADDPETWRAAREHYFDHCAVCHGRDGRGQTEVGTRMYPPVPDLTDAAVQERTDGALYYIVQNGVRWTGMPAWKDEHSPDETWRLISLVRKMPTLMEGDMVIERQTSESPTQPAHSHEQPHGRGR